MSRIKSLLDDINERLYANASRVELHWMEQEYEKQKQEQYDENIQYIEVDCEIETSKKSKEEETPEVGGSGHYKTEVFDYQFINKVRTSGDV